MVLPALHVIYASFTTCAGFSGSASNIDRLREPGDEAGGRG